LDFLQNLSADYFFARDVHRILELFNSGREKRQKDLLMGVAEAVSRLSLVPDGLLTLKDCGAIEAIAAVAADPPEAGGKHSIHTVNGLCQGVIAWCEAFDPVNFMDISNLLYFAQQLGGLDEDLALSTMDAIARCAHHRPEHTAGMLKAGVLNVLHTFVSEHRNPEFVEEVFGLIYLLCDLPSDVVIEPLMAELELLSTVMELLEDAPLNMRLQLTGLRLLAMLLTRFQDTEEKEVPMMILESGARSLLENACEKLQKGGFPDLAAWLSAVAGGAFCIPG